MFATANIFNAKTVGPLASKFGSMHVNSGPDNEYVSPRPSHPIKGAGNQSPNFFTPTVFAPQLTCLVLLNLTRWLITARCGPYWWRYPSPALGRHLSATCPLLSVTKVHQKTLHKEGLEVMHHISYKSKVKSFPEP